VKTTNVVPCENWVVGTLLAVLLSCAIFCGTARAEDVRPVVRLAGVNTSGLLDAILPGFEQASGYRVQVCSGSDVFS
jgi:ABC-type tungstate transport system permease subunit